MKITLIKLILVFSSFTGYTQELWTYEKCVTYMLENNLSLQQQKVARQTNLLDVSKSRLELLPQISVGTRSNIGLGRSIDPLTNNFTNDPVFSASGNLDISLTVFDGFKKWNAIKKAKLRLAVKDWEIKKQDRDVRIELASIYMQLLFNIEKLKNEKEQLTLNNEQLKRVTILVKEGRLAINDKNNLIAAVALNELQILRAKDAVFQSKFELKQLLQLPEEESLDLAWPELEATDDSVLLYTYESISNIVEELPETKVTELSIEQREIDYKESKAFFLPRVSLSYTVGSSVFSNSVTLSPGIGNPQTFINEIGFTSQDNGITRGNAVFQEQIIDPDAISETTNFNTQIDQNFYQSIGIGIDIPFLNSSNYIQQYKKRTALDLKQAKIEAKIESNIVRKNFNQLLMEAKTAHKSYQIAKKRLDIVKESYRVTVKKYNVGRTGYVDYLTSSTSLESAKDELIQSKYNSILKSKILKFYMGEEISLD